MLRTIFNGRAGRVFGCRPFLKEDWYSEGIIGKQIWRARHYAYGVRGGI
jgi:hypothetical protein